MNVARREDAAPQEKNGYFYVDENGNVDALKSEEQLLECYISFR